MAVKELDLPVIGMHCAGCANAIQRALQKKTDGVQSADVNLATDSVRVVYDPDIATLEAMAASVEAFGYQLVLPGVGDESEDAESRARRLEVLKQKRALLVGILFTLPLAALSMARDASLLGAWAHDFRVNILFWLLATPVQFYTGWGFHIGAWRSLRAGAANMDVLVSLGSNSAYFYSLVLLLPGMHGHVYFETAALILTLIKVGKWLEARARGRTSDAIKALLNLAPKTAVLVDEDGTTRTVPVGMVQEGSLVLVRPGEVFPVDGVIVQGDSSTDESALTGESMPVDKGTEDAVYGGTINLTSSLRVRATGVGSDTAMARIVALVRKAQGSKAPIQRIADRISAVFVPVIVVIALVTLLLWWGLSGSFETAIIRMVAVLVIACPCALGLATPTAVTVGMGIAARQGVLFRDAEAVEAAGRLGTILLDKTGTLTRGRPVVTDLKTMPGVSEEELLRVTATAQQPSQHPLALAVIRSAKERDIQFGIPESHDVLPGIGIRARVAGEEVRVLKPDADLLDSEQLETLQALYQAGKSVMTIERGGVLLGWIAAADELKPGVGQAVDELKKLGTEPVMVTGDNSRAARAVADEIGISRVIADVLPEGKEEVVRSEQESGRRVAMVGDGINDAPALARADVGIAIGGGTDVAVETAAVTLMSGELAGLGRVVRLSRVTMRTIHQNLFWAFAYNVALIPVAAGLLALFDGLPKGVQQLHPAMAAAAMAFSSVTVVFNSLRLKVSSSLRR